MRQILKNFTVTAALVATVAMLPTTAPAFMGDDGQPPAGKHFKKMAQELGLTAEQKQQIKEVFAKHKPQAEPLMKQLMTERRALRELVQADTVDEAAIKAQAAKIAGVQGDLAVLRAHGFKEIRALLTPEQAAKAKELQAKRDKKMAERANHLGKRFERD